MGCCSFFFPFFNLHLVAVPRNDNTLVSDPTHHVKRTFRRTVQCDLLHVLLHALLDDPPQLLLDTEEPVRRAHAAQCLVRPLVVVVLHPELDSFLRLLERPEGRVAQELIPDASPEPLDLAQCLRMMAGASNVLHPVPLQ
jgi:hypothetical protein